MSGPVVVGVDLGGTNVRAGLVADGRLRDVRSVPVRSRGSAEDVLEDVLRHGAALARRLDADLEVLADPQHPKWPDIEARLTELARGDLGCHLSPLPGLDIRQLVDYARGRKGIVSVVVGRPTAWAGESGANGWSRLECPLVAASDLPGLPREA